MEIVVFSPQWIYAMIGSDTWGPEEASEVQSEMQIKIGMHFRACEMPPSALLAHDFHTTLSAASVAKLSLLAPLSQVLATSARVHTLSAQDCNLDGLFCKK